jgi:hypothetical protein
MQLPPMPFTVTNWSGVTLLQPYIPARPDKPSMAPGSNAVTTRKQDHECAGSLSSEEEHSLGPADEWYIADDLRSRHVLPKSDAERRDCRKHEQERQSRSTA